LSVTTSIHNRVASRIRPLPFPPRHLASLNICSNGFTNRQAQQRI
jgi:hypothetical protein